MDEITQDMRELWLMLRRDGGWWTIKMLAHHFGQRFAAYEVQQAVDALEAWGHIESVARAGTRIYAITSDCQALPDPQPGGAS